MAFFILEPEVAGELGDKTIMNTSVQPPRVDALHYVLDAWLGDDLLESFPCFVISTTLADRLSDAGMTGFGMADVEVTVTDECRVLMGPRRRMPDFVWLQVKGTPGVDDLGLTSKATLVASERCLAVLRTGVLEHCNVRDF